jgi:hypothetical protein
MRAANNTRGKSLHRRFLAQRRFHKFGPHTFDGHGLIVASKLTGDN